MFRVTGLAKIGACLCVALTAPLTFGQEVLEEIIVTAQKRDQLLQDVPISVQVVSGELLKEQGVSDLQDVANFMPNVDVDQGINGVLIRARGISTASFPGAEQSVAVFNDGLYYGRPAMAIAGLFDIAQVEALMGPQPVYFGQSAIAGLISYRSQRPTQETDGYVLLEAGDQDQLSFEGAVGGGIGENWAIRVAGRYQENDGYLTRAFDGAPADASEDSALRLSLAGDISDNLSLFFKTEQWEQVSDGAPMATIVCAPTATFCNRSILAGAGADYSIGTYTVNTGSDLPVPGPLPPFFFPLIDLTAVPEVQTDMFGNDADGSSSILELGWQINDDLLFTSLTGYADYDMLSTLDIDAVPFAFVSITRPENYEQVSQELRLQSTGGGDLQWMLGAYWQDQEMYHRFTVFNGSSARGSAGQVPNDFNLDTTYTNLFGSLTWTIADDWTADFGLRYEEVEKSALSQTLMGDMFDAAGNVINPMAGGVAVRAGEPYIGPNYQCMGIDPRTGNVCVITQDLGMTFIEAPLDLDDDEVTYQAALTWDVTDEHSLWVRHAKGYKPGGFASDQSSFGLPERGIFKAETAETTEFGGHFNFLDGRLRVNAAVYHTEYEDQQVVVSVVNPITGNANFNVTNASSSTIDGIEADLTYAAENGFTFFASVGTMDGQYDSFVPACSQTEENDALMNPVTPPTGPGLIGQTGAAGCVLANPQGNIGFIDRSGTDFPGQPNWTATLRASKRWNVGDNLMLTLSGIATFYDDWDDTLAIPEAHREQDSFSLINVNAGIGSQDGTWLVSIYGRNITDEWYWMQQPGSVGGGGTARAFVRRPESWGAQLRYNFGN